MTGSGKVTFGVDSFEGAVAFDMKTGGKPKKVQQTLSGKWIGAKCE